jgi:hypothetical protein
MNKLFTYVDPGVEELVRTLSKIQGIGTSEYIRNLIIADLDTRSIFTTELKAKLFGNNNDGGEGNVHSES